MAWRRAGDKPLSEPRMISLPTHICVSRPQWDKRLSNPGLMTRISVVELGYLCSGQWFITCSATIYQRKQRLYIVNWTQLATHFFLSKKVVFEKVVWKNDAHFIQASICYNWKGNRVQNTWTLYKNGYIVTILWRNIIWICLVWWTELAHIFVSEMGHWLGRMGYRRIISMQKNYLRRPLVK